MAIGGIHGKKKRELESMKKKKTKDPNRPVGKFKKTSKRDRYEDNGKSSTPKSTVSAQPKLSIFSEKKPSGPPWQVMGVKDMKINIEKEKLRRERTRLQLDALSADDTIDHKLKADVSGINRLISSKDRTMLNWKRFNPISAPSELTLVGAYLEKQVPPSLGVPEVAFLGRSNVGKSSLLNRLVSNVGGETARVGKTPGATACVNLYALLGPRRKDNIGKPILGFTDLPGFGYAKLSKETKESVEAAAERYLGKRRELALGILLVDSRRIPSADDRAVLAALFDMGVPLVVVATKTDKLNKNEVQTAMNTIREGLGLPDGQPLKVSGVTGEGVRELWRIILDACESRVNELKLAIEEGRDDGGSLRLLDENEDDENDFNETEEGEQKYFPGYEDIHYDQGYDWIQHDNFEVEEIYDSFYDDNSLIEDTDGSLEESWISVTAAKRRDENEAKQKSEKEALKLKNLKKVVRDMEKRGQI